MPADFIYDQISTDLLNSGELEREYDEIIRKQRDAGKDGGPAEAGRFVVRLAVDGAQSGDETVSSLEAGQEREVRFGEVLMKKGEHKLPAALDPKGSVAEVVTRLKSAQRRGWLTAEECARFTATGDEIGRMLGGWIKYLARCNWKDRGRFKVRQREEPDGSR